MLCPDIADIKEAECAGMNLLEMLWGYEKVIIIDSVRTKGGRPGDIYRFKKDGLGGVDELYSSHQLGLSSLIKLSGFLKESLSLQAQIFALEIGKKDFFREGLSKKIRSAVEKVAYLVKEELRA
jgi:hydrogenase maturation protease